MSRGHTVTDVHVEAHTSCHVIGIAALHHGRGTHIQSVSISSFGFRATTGDSVEDVSPSFGYLA